MNDFWKNRRVFVTGATGLLGSWLVKQLLDNGAEPVCLVRDWVPQSEFVRASLLERCVVVRGDLCDLETLERTLVEYEIETVFNLAAQTIVTVANESPLSTLETNIRGTWRLLEACRKTSFVKQIVTASSDKAYGEQKTLPYREDMPFDAVHPYDVSKSCADWLARMFAHSYGVPVVITRCGNFYGGGDLNWNRIVPGTIRSVIQGTRPILRSNGKSIRDYIYVKDGANACLLLAEKLAADPSLAGQSFNFSCEAPISVIDLVQRILAVMGSNLEVDIRASAKNEIKDQFLSSEKARQLLGWKPDYSMDEALNFTIEWYQEYFHSKQTATYTLAEK